MSTDGIRVLLREGCKSGTVFCVNASTQFDNQGGFAETAGHNVNYYHENMNKRCLQVFGHSLGTRAERSVGTSSSINMTYVKTVNIWIATGSGPISNKGKGYFAIADPSLIIREGNKSSGNMNLFAEFGIGQSEIQYTYNTQAITGNRRIGMGAYAEGAGFPTYLPSTMHIFFTRVELIYSPPVPNPGPDISTYFGQPTQKTGTATGGAQFGYNFRWSFTDDGVNHIVYSNVLNHTFSRPGVYTLSLRVSDGYGGSATETCQVTVYDDTDPIANAGPDRETNEGGTVLLNGSGSTDDVAIETFEWVIDDGSGSPINKSGAMVTHTFNTVGTYTQTLTVTDYGGNTDSDTCVVNVHEINAAVLGGMGTDPPTGQTPPL